MENQSSFESNCISQSCIYCIQKDQIIKKYQKLVQLLKKKAKRCSSYTIGSLSTSQHAKQAQQFVQNFIQSRNCGFLPTVSQKTDNQSSTISPDVEQKYKIIDQNQLINLRKSGIEIRNKVSVSAPAGFYRSQTSDWKKITLSTDWLKKYKQLSKKLNEKQYRVNMLSDQIFSLKNEFLYIRSIFIQLIKSLKIKASQLSSKYKLTIDNHSRGIISLLINLFQYSQQEINEIFGIGQKMIEKNVKRRYNQNKGRSNQQRQLLMEKQNIRRIR